MHVGGGASGGAYVTRRAAQLALSCRGRVVSCCVMNRSVNESLENRFLIGTRIFVVCPPPATLLHRTSTDKNVFRGIGMLIARGRYEVYCDGIFAIAATFSVLEFRLGTHTSISTWFAANASVVHATLLTLFGLFAMWLDHQKVSNNG